MRAIECATRQYHDFETDLDYFGARYYSNSQGRFMSPDWSDDPDPVPYADLNDPQSLNLYAYVGNNAISATDDDGHDPFPDNNDPKPAGRCGFLCNLKKWWNTPRDPGAKTDDPIGKVLINSLIGFYNFGNRLFGVPRQDPYLSPSSPQEAKDMQAISLALLFVPDLGEELAAEKVTYLYEKISVSGTHLKYGITRNPLTRYTGEELAGGKLKILAKGSRRAMLQLERKLHETLPLGPEEGQLFYILKQVEKGLKAPPYQ